MNKILGDLNMDANFLRFLSTAPVMIFALLSFTAGLLIEFNRFFPDLLFHPLP
jgi:photosystem I subunit IX